MPQIRTLKKGVAPFSVTPYINPVLTPFEKRDIICQERNLQKSPAQKGVVKLKVF